MILIKHGSFILYINIVLIMFQYYNNIYKFVKIYNKNLKYQKNFTIS